MPLVVGALRWWACGLIFYALHHVPAPNVLLAQGHAHPHARQHRAHGRPDRPVRGALDRHRRMARHRHQRHPHRRRGLLHPELHHACDTACAGASAATTCVASGRCSAACCWPRSSRPLRPGAVALALAPLVGGVVGLARTDRRGRRSWGCALAIALGRLFGVREVVRGDRRIPASRHAARAPRTVSSREHRGPHPGARRGRARSPRPSPPRSPSRVSRASSSSTTVPKTTPTSSPRRPAPRSCGCSALTARALRSRSARSASRTPTSCSCSTATWATAPRRARSSLAPLLAGDGRHDDRHLSAAGRQGRVRPRQAPRTLRDRTTRRRLRSDGRPCPDSAHSRVRASPQSARSRRVTASRWGSPSGRCAPGSGWSRSPRRCRTRRRDAISRDSFTVAASSCT